MRAEPRPYDDTTARVCFPFNSWGCIVCSQPRLVVGSTGTVKTTVADFTGATTGDCNNERSSSRYCLRVAAREPTEQAGPTALHLVVSTFPSDVVGTRSYLVPRSAVLRHHTYVRVYFIAQDCPLI